MIEYAYAKVNRFLRLTGRRPDGYHTLRSVMQTVSLRDELTYEPGSPFLFDCSDSRLDTPHNLCVKAAKAFFDASGIRPNGHLALRKAIPFGAGLGGGSADAAAVLRLLQEANGRPLSESSLFALALGLGADVPFCIHGGKALCEGIGEVLTILPDEPEEYLLILKPEGALSTAEMYRMWDEMHPGGPEQGPDSGNEFEPIAFRLLPVVQTLRDGLLHMGAREALMTGSGSAVFGRFDSLSACEEAENRLKNDRSLNLESGVAFTAVCRTIVRY